MHALFSIIAVLYCCILVSLSLPIPLPLPTSTISSLILHLEKLNSGLDPVVDEAIPLSSTPRPVPAPSSASSSSSTPTSEEHGAAQIELRHEPESTRLRPQIRSTNGRPDTVRQHPDGGSFQCAVM